MPLRSRRDRRRQQRVKPTLVANVPSPPALLGEGQPCKDHGVLEYASFRAGDETFAVGDCACLQNPDADSDPFVCRIQRIYQRKGIEPQVTVCWFYRPSDTALRPSELKGCAPGQSLLSSSLTRQLPAITAPPDRIVHLTILLSCHPY